MNMEVRRMLDNMYGLFTEKFHDPVKAWDYLVEFLVVDNCGSLFLQLEHKFEWLFKDSRFADRLMKTYDPELLRSDYYDHLGELYVERILGLAGNEESGEIPILIEDSNPDRVIELRCGTGRQLMARREKNPNVAIYGVEPDLRLYRIALANFAIHDIKGLLLHADPKIHALELKTEEGRQNWKLADRWNPDIRQLKRLPKKKASRDKHPKVELNGVSQKRK